MKFSFDLSNLTLLLLLTSHTHNVIGHPTTDLAVAPLDAHDATQRPEDVFVTPRDLYKRKGGGGGGGKGGGGGSSSGSGGKGGSGSSSSGYVPLLFYMRCAYFDFGSVGYEYDGDGRRAWKASEVVLHSPVGEGDAQ